MNNHQTEVIQHPSPITENGELREATLKLLGSAKEFTQSVQNHLTTESKRKTEELIDRACGVFQWINGWFHKQLDRLHASEAEKQEAQALRDEIARMESEGGVPPS